MEKQRIAILGSGVGAITTAWALTSLPDAHDRFDITIYTLGWRLGGKGASGRNAAFGQRIEDLNNDYLEDPVFGMQGMRRTREKVRLPLATNTPSPGLNVLTSPPIDTSVDPESW